MTQLRFVAINYGAERGTITLVRICNCVVTPHITTALYATGRYMGALGIICFNFAILICFRAINFEVANEDGTRGARAQLIFEGRLRVDMLDVAKEG